MPRLPENGNRNSASECIATDADRRTSILLASRGEEAAQVLIRCDAQVVVNLLRAQIGQQVVDIDHLLLLPLGIILWTRLTRAGLGRLVLSQLLRHVEVAHCAAKVKSRNGHEQSISAQYLRQNQRK